MIVWNITKKTIYNKNIKNDWSNMIGRNLELSCLSYIVKADIQVGIFMPNKMSIIKGFVADDTVI